jgi:CubicO group peptidase (beta-lactamase class C family)
MNKLDGSHPLVNLLGLIMLFIDLQVHAQAGGTQTTPEQVNQAVRETQEPCENQIEKGAVPGLAIAVVFQDQVVYAAGFGVRDVNTQEPVNADTVFQLASLSKPIGSTVVAELVGEGKISWDSKINDLDPDFAMYDPWVTHEITIRDFYAHRSGLPDHAGDLLEDLGFTR